MKKYFIIIFILLFATLCYGQTLVDNFNRPDGVLTSDGWGQVEGSNIITGGITGGSTASHENLAYTPTVYNANMAAFVTVSAKCADNEGLSLFIRFNSSTFSGYDLQFTTQTGVGTDRLRLFRYDNGSFGSQLGSTYFTEVSVGDKFGIVANGSSLKCYYLPVNTKVWLLIIDVTNTAYASGGRIAMGAYGNVGRYDDLIGGNDLNLPTTVLFESSFNNDANWTPTQTTYSSQFCFTDCDFLIGWTAYNQAPSQCLPAITGDPGYNSIYVNSVAGYPRDSEVCRSGKCVTKWQEACDAGDAFDDSDANLGKDLGAEYDELYFQFWVKIPQSFTLSNDGQGFKIFHIQHYNPDGCTPAGNPWQYFEYCAPNDWNFPMTAGGFRSYENSVDFYLEARGNTEVLAHGYVFWRLQSLTAARAAGGIADGNWHCIELHVVNNSAIGVSDGYIDLWVDGVARTEATGYEAHNIDWNNTLGGANTDKRGFRFVSILGNNTKWTTACTDGSGDIVNCEQWYAVDDVVVSTTYIGTNYIIVPPTPAPAINITTLDQLVTTSFINIVGTASATSPLTVKDVTWSNNRGGSGTCTGTTNWSAIVTLSSGFNIITFTAEDSANSSSNDIVTIQYTPPVTTQKAKVLKNSKFKGGRLH